MSSVAQPASLPTNLQLIRWLLSQGERVPVLIGYYDAFLAAPDIATKWSDAIRPAIDLLVQAIGTLPDLNADSVSVLADVQAEATAQGFDWNKLVGATQTLLPIVLDVILRLRG